MGAAAMHPNVIDLSGQRFGRLTVLGRAANNQRRQARWRVRCACGQERAVAGYSLRSGRSRSCGCLSAEVAARLAAKLPRDHATKHGFAKTPAYFALSAARGRCNNPTNAMFKHYGGRGIEYRLPEDLGEATALLIEAIGPRPEGLTLDRIDNDGHYEIGNLRWATTSEQNRNKRYPKAHQ